MITVLTATALRKLARRPAFLSLIAPIILLAYGDSIGVGIDVADPLIDLDWPGVYQVRFRAPVGISSDITPLDQLVDPDGANYLSPYTYIAKQIAANTGADVYIVPSNKNGSKFGSTGWGVGNPHHEDTIARWNTAIATVLAARPNAVVGGIFQIEAANDALAAGPVATYDTALAAGWADMQARTFLNGVSGADISNVKKLIIGMLPEFLGSTLKVTYELALRKRAAALPKGMFYQQPEGVVRSDNLHNSAAGIRIIGPAIGNLLTSTTAPVISGVLGTGAYTMYAGQNLSLEVLADQYVTVGLSGANAADFEINTVSEGASGISLARLHTYLRFNGDSTKAAGTYNVTLTFSNGPDIVRVIPYTFTLLAAYGTVPGTVAATSQYYRAAASANNDALLRARIPVNLGAGLNVLFITKSSGSVADIASVSFNGHLAVRDTASDTPNTWCYLLPSPVAQSGTLIVTPTSSSFGNVILDVILLTGTKGSALTSSKLAYGSSHASPSISPSLTCPAGGIIVGRATSSATLTDVAGITRLATNSPAYTGYRTTDGSIGGTHGSTSTSGVIALAFEAA